MACDKACLFGAEPQYGIGNFLGTTHTANRFLGNHAGAALLGIAGEARDHVGINDPRAKGIHSDTLGSMFQSRAFTNGGDAVF
ncbi:hypothetical protein D3C76_1716400 [compost metagenome]